MFIISQKGQMSRDLWRGEFLTMCWRQAGPQDTGRAHLAGAARGRTTGTLGCMWCLRVLGCRRRRPGDTSLQGRAQVALGANGKTTERRVPLLVLSRTYPLSGPELEALREVTKEGWDAPGGVRAHEAPHDHTCG